MNDKQSEQQAFDLGAKARDAYDSCISKRDKKICGDASVKFTEAATNLNSACVSGNKYACKYLPKYEIGPEKITTYIDACINKFDQKFVSTDAKNTMDEVCKGRINAENIRKLKQYIGQQGQKS